MNITGCKMAGIVDPIQTRYYAFKVIFTIVLCFIPYVFLWYTLSALLIIIVIKVIETIWKRMTDTRIEPRGRGVLITGCDSGFGFVFAKHFDELGFTVFAGCLNEKGDGAKKLRKDSSKRFHVVEIDISKDKSVSNALTYVKNNLPRKGLWGVINNAGINMYGEVELIPVSLYETGFGVNLYGHIRVMREFLYLIRREQGRIVNITSVHGRYSMPVQTNYETAKHGMETLSDSLRLEMTKFGVKVCVVEPGMFAGSTSILNEAMVKRRKDDIEEMWTEARPEVKKSYSKSYMLSWLPKPMGKWPPQDSDTWRVVSAVEHAICSESPLSRYLVDGTDGLTSFFDQYAMLARVHNILPTWIIDNIIAVWKNCCRSSK